MNKTLVSIEIFFVILLDTCVAKLQKMYITVGAIAFSCILDTNFNCDESFFTKDACFRQKFLLCDSHEEADMLWLHYDSHARAIYYKYRYLFVLFGNVETTVAVGATETFDAMLIAAILCKNGTLRKVPYFLKNLSCKFSCPSCTLLYTGIMQ